MLSRGSDVGVSDGGRSEGRGRKMREWNEAMGSGFVDMDDSRSGEVGEVQLNAG